MVVLDRVPDRCLFDVEDVSAVPSVRGMLVDRCTVADAREFSRRYHYSGTDNCSNWRWGLWHGATLYGVISYNLPTRSTCGSLFGEDHVDKVWHMSKLAMSEVAPKNSESRLIGGSLQAITREHPDVWGVVTYAATDVGHVGYVYQATNAIYTGSGGEPVYYVDQQGHRRGTYLDGRRVSGERAASMGWAKKVGGSKHRYVYILGNTKTQRRARRAALLLPDLPYPKSVSA